MRAEDRHLAGWGSDGMLVDVEIPVTGSRLSQERARGLLRGMTPHLDLLVVDIPSVINNALGGLICAAVIALLAYLVKPRRSAPRRRGRR